MRCLVWILFINSILAKYFSYEGYTVYRVLPSNEEQLKTLVAYTSDASFDFWSSLGIIGRPVDIMVKPPAQNKFVHDLRDWNISYSTLIKNVAEVIMKERKAQSLVGRLSKGRISFMSYNRYSQINDYLDETAKAHPSLASIEIAGRSYEGRDLKVIKISTNGGGKRPIIFVDAGLHAREWVAPALATYIIHQLVENADNAALSANVDWHVLPIVNPDGYEYTHTDMRFWRKTRSKGKLCEGVDGNRNFDFHWGEVDTSSDECTEIYHGPEPFSEPETRAVRDYILKYKDNIRIYVTLHSYGPFILYPWGYANELPDNAKELQELGDAAADAIRAVGGVSYAVGSSANVLYPASGGSDDWAKAVAGVDLSYTIELQGGGNDGFNPDAIEILPIVAESWEAFKVFHEHVERKYSKKPTKIPKSYKSGAVRNIKVAALLLQFLILNVLDDNVHIIHLI